MPILKRTAPAVAAAACTTTAPAAKKAKKIPEELKIAEVQEALQNADLSPAEIEALMASVPFCLGIARSARHKFQEQAITVIADVLAGMETRAESMVDAASKECDEARRVIDAREAVVQQASKAHEAKVADSSKHKTYLAATARKFQETKAALRDAEEKQSLGDAEDVAAGNKMKEVDGLLRDMDTLSDDASKVNRFILCLDRNVSIDDSMKTPLSSVLSKKADVRGPFDLMIFKSLCEKITGRKAELQVQIDTSATSCAERVAAVEAAQKRFLAAQDDQMTSAKAYTDAADLAASGDSSVKNARKEMLAELKKNKEKESSLAETQISLDRLRTLPLAAFSELREREAPVSCEASTEPVEASPSPPAVDEIDLATAFEGEAVEANVQQKAASLDVVAV